MKALCVADIHGDREAVDRLAASLAGMDIDYVFLLGDYSKGFKNAAENRNDILYVLEAFRNFSVRAIPGNCDQKESINLLKEKNASLHSGVIEYGGTALIGFGGSNPTPFKTPLEFTEEEIYRSLREMVQSVKKRAKRIVFITHFPPKDTKCDEIPGGKHVGSESLRKIIQEHKPELVLCSHIHESGGMEDKVGETRVVNVGRISEGRAILLTVDDTVSVESYTG